MYELVREIKEKIKLEDVVRGYVTLKKDGGYLKGGCPFCGDKSANGELSDGADEFVVSSAKQIYYCFSCHHGGDVITFIAKKNNISQLEAMFDLAKKYNLNVMKKNTVEV